MKAIELSKPTFEQGYKGPLQVVSRRVAMNQLFPTRDVVNNLFKSSLSPKIMDLKSRVESVLNPEDPAHNLILENLLFFPHDIFLRASKFHLDNWLRDSFVTCLALNDPDLEIHLLNNFIDLQNNNGQVPTTRLFASDRRWLFEDESSALALVWRLKIADMGIPLEEGEKAPWQKVLDWLQTHNQNGYYVTPAGTEKSWFDTFKFSQDVITYNQGIFATALIAAEKLELEVKNNQIIEAINAYRSLTNPSGRLKLSAAVPYYDLSGLFGNYISHYLFGINLLAPETVITTLKSQPRYDDFNMYIVANERGTPLAPSEFNRPYKAGDYQNGADWPLFTVIAQYEAERNGLEHNNQLFWQEKLRLILESNSAEYMHPGKSKVIYNPLHINHAWNAAAYKIASEVMGTNDYFSTIHHQQTNLFSEAAQLQDSTL